MGTTATGSWPNAADLCRALLVAPCRWVYPCLVMTTPVVPARLRSCLVASEDGLPGRYKVRLPHGHTVYEVRIDNDGMVTQVDGRLVHCNADLGFRMEDAEAIESY